MQPTSQAIDRQRAREEAAQWVVRLSGSAGADERAAFEAWRGASLNNEVAYARALATWNRLDRLTALRDPARSPHDAMAAIDAEAAYAQASSQGWRQWAALAASLLLVVSLVTVAIFFIGVAPSPVYATGIGERRVIMLADGTRVELNTNSSITVHYASGHRSIDLDKGEALFHIIRDPRPFEVRAGAVHLQIAQAEVGIRIQDRSTMVTVTQGQVSLQDFTHGAPNAPLILPERSLATIAPAMFTLARLSDMDIRRDLAWRQGQIALSGETLTEAAGEFNRYNRRQIHIADPQAGRIRVGGYFDTSDLDGFLKAVGYAFPVRVASDPSGDVTISAAAAS